MKYAIEHGMINDICITDQLVDMVKSKYLNQHKWAIQKGKDGFWRTYVPCDDGKRKMIKKKKLEDLEDAIVSFYQTAGNTTFQIMFDEWKKLQKSYGVSNNTLQKYDSDYRRFFTKSALEDVELRKLTEEDITRFMIHTVKKLNLRPKTGTALWGYVKNVFTYAYRHKYITDNPCDYVSTKSFTKFYNKHKASVSERTLNGTELQALLDELHDTHLKKPAYIQPYAVELAIFTGMRVGELAALRWRDVLEDIGVIRIVASEKFDRGTKQFYISDTKNGEDREFPITEDIRRILKAVKTVEMSEGYIGDFVFQNASGRVHARSISECMRHKCEQAGIDAKGIHALRRTLNSRMKCNGVPRVIAASLLGHTEEVNDTNYTYDVSGLNYKREVLSKVMKIS